MDIGRGVISSEPWPGDVVLRWETETGWAHAGFYDGNRVWFLSFVHLPRTDVETVAQRAGEAGWTAILTHGADALPAARDAEHETWAELWIRREQPTAPRLPTSTTEQAR